MRRLDFFEDQRLFHERGRSALAAVEPCRLAGRSAHALKAGKAGVFMSLSKFLAGACAAALFAGSAQAQSAAEAQQSAERVKASSDRSFQ